MARGASSHPRAEGPSGDAQGRGGADGPAAGTSRARDGLHRPPHAARKGAQISNCSLGARRDTAMVYFEDLGTPAEISMSDLESFLDSQERAAAPADDVRNFQVEESAGPAIVLA